MNFYSVQFGLEASAGQGQLMDSLKSDGAEVIQTSNGLCVKSEKSLEQIKTLVGSSTSVSLLDKSEVAADAAAPKDLKAFLGL